MQIANIAKESKPWFMSTLWDFKVNKISSKPREIATDVFVCVNQILYNKNV